MKVLSKTEANELLRPLELKIGEWNELAELSSDRGVSYRLHKPLREARHLYVLADHLLDWLSSDGWILLQVDNSTVTFDHEDRVFEKLVFNDEQRWDIDNQRSFLFDDVGLDKRISDRNTILLLILFSLMFEWHVYFTGDSAGLGQRLGLQDGFVYFIADEKRLRAADELVHRVAEDPLTLS